MNSVPLPRRVRRLLFRRCAVLRFFLLLNRSSYLSFFPPSAQLPRFSSLLPLQFYSLFKYGFSLSLARPSPSTGQPFASFVLGFLVLESEFLGVSHTYSPLSALFLFLKPFSLPFVFLHSFFRLCQHFRNW